MTNVKPFVKWAGGKRAVLLQLQRLLPTDFVSWKNATYVEPFVGGGAMLFHILQSYPNIKRAVINDANGNLTLCYRMVRDEPLKLIKSLGDIQSEYLAMGDGERKGFFYERRELYNHGEGLTDIERASLFIFLNKTCFNGLYRVNRSGGFNVPFGRYRSPLICDSETIMADSEALQKVDIMTGDFSETLNEAVGNTFFYLDPPYRPLGGMQGFTSYTKEGFSDAEHVRLKRFCDSLNHYGYPFMLSNSDGSNGEHRDTFLDGLYHDYNIERVWAARSVNSDGSGRGKVTEIVVRNY